MIALADLKILLGITISTDDALLAMLEDTATSMIETEIDNKIDVATISGEKITYDSSEFDLQSYHHLDLNDRPLEVQLRYYPVVSGVVLAVPGETALVADTDYDLDSTNGVILIKGLRAGTVINGLKATYSAGYAEGASPKSLQYVAVEMIKYMYQNANAKKGKGGDIKSKSLGDLSVSYKENLSIVQQYSSILNKFKSVSG